MRSTKDDRRSKYTRYIIKKSLLSLLADTPIKKISVAELCKAADVTRGTFYNHYYDVYDVYDDIEDELVDSLKEKLVGIKAYDLDNVFLQEMIRFIQDNNDFVSLLLANLSDSSFFKRIFKYVKNQYITDFSERFTNINKSKIEFFFTYTTNGTIGILVEWLKEGQKQPAKEIADSIYLFTKIIEKEYFGIR